MRFLLRGQISIFPTRGWENRDLTPVIVAVVLSYVSAGVVSGASQPAATQTIVASANVTPRASLEVSTQVLHFQVTSQDEAAMATVDFVAGSRTRRDGEVLLILQPIEMFLAPGDRHGALTFVGEGEGTLPGAASTDGPTVAARWIGGGRRTGSLRFTLRAAPGTYTVPVRLVVTAL